MLSRTPMSKKLGGSLHVVEVPLIVFDITWRDLWLLATCKQVKSKLIPHVCQIAPFNDSTTRYINMDYLFFSSLEGSEAMELIMSYNIACQWSVHIWDCMAIYNHHLHFDRTGCKIIFLVPKFHLPAHIARCQTAYSFNPMARVGRMDGEAAEHGWADINRIATSTWEMGPGSRWDTLDDHFGDWNWKKIMMFGEPCLSVCFVLVFRTYISSGPSLLWKLKDTVSEQGDQVWAFNQIMATLPLASVTNWTAAIELWESDNTQVNPFVATMKSKLCW